ncbi:hypothetical protein M9H77_14047 [Catharanthus roseus]|uniref:Uncharacterized protein n=1 Tax=Catharanthus roseus TaxID=4058 RepID=A0ACC0BM38_CATRO|nr:hypothetical protein M9H77_14047 [Catharanthus roseus]
MATNGKWQLLVQDGRHNYIIGVYHHGHAQAVRLMEEQLKLTEQFRKNHMAPRNMLRIFRKQNWDCAVRYNILEAIGMASASKNFTIAIAFMRNEEMHFLAKGVICLILPLDPGTSHIGSTYKLHIERYKSQVDLDQGLDQDLVQILVWDPVGEVGRHGLQGIEMDRIDNMIAIRHLVYYQHFIAVSETLFSHVFF